MALATCLILFISPGLCSAWQLLYPPSFGTHTWWYENYKINCGLEMNTYLCTRYRLTQYTKLDRWQCSISGQPTQAKVWVPKPQEASLRDKQSSKSEATERKSNTFASGFFVPRFLFILSNDADILDPVCTGAHNDRINFYNTITQRAYFGTFSFMRSSDCPSLNRWPIWKKSHFNIRT